MFYCNNDLFVCQLLWMGGELLQSKLLGTYTKICRMIVTPTLASLVYPGFTLPYLVAFKIIRLGLESKLVY
jgi:hypothetical protein